MRIHLLFEPLCICPSYGIKAQPSLYSNYLSFQLDSACAYETVGSRGTFPLVYYAVGTKNISCNIKVSKQDDGNPFLLAFSQMELPNAELTVGNTTLTGTNLIMSLLIHQCPIPSFHYECSPFWVGIFIFKTTMFTVLCRHAHSD